MSAVLMMALALSACGGSVHSAVDDGSGDDGGGVGQETEVVSIAYLKSLYNGRPHTLTGNSIIRGYVVSSDRYGNFHKTLVIEDATAGIEVKIDRAGLFGDYRIGDEVEVYCNSLTIGAYGGLVQLGSVPTSGYETGYISGSDIPKHIANTDRKAESVRPQSLTLGDLAPKHLSRFVSFSGVSFEAAVGGAKWCDAGEGGFEDTDRMLVDDDGNALAVRTSGHAEFAGTALPSGRIYIEGILSWFNGGYQLRIIEPGSAVVPEI